MSLPESLIYSKLDKEKQWDTAGLKSNLCDFSRIFKSRYWVCCLLVGLFYVDYLYADESAADFIEFDDRPLEQDLVLPSWFKLSFLELGNDLADAAESGKWGVLLYFGRKDCPYCKVHLKKNWSDRGIMTYTQKHFDVIAIDVRGDRPVVDHTGQSYKSEKEYAAKLKTNFTPSFLFIDVTGEQTMQLTGYRPPYQFRAILEYIADKHYLYERLPAYIARGESIAGLEESELHDHEAFSSPPFDLAKKSKADKKSPVKKPVAVFFEQPTCHACNVLHAGPLKNNKIIAGLKQMEVVQLDRYSDTEVITPLGKKTTARKWSEELGIYYSPTILFFDDNGKELLRIDSVIRFYRLNGVLEYILSKAYLEHETFQIWRHNTRR